MIWYVRTVMSLSLLLWVVASYCTTGHPTSRLHHRISHKRLKHARIKAIQQEILTKLGLTHVPTVSNSNVTVEEKRKMLKLYKKSVDQTAGKVHELFSEEEFFAKSFHSFTDIGSAPSEADPQVWRNDPVTKRLFIPVDVPHPTDHRRETHIHSAKLKLYVMPKRTSHTLDLVRLDIYQLQDGQSGHKKLLDSKLVSLLGSGWTDFDVRPAVQAWTETPRSNFGLEVVCEGRNVHELLDIATIGSDNDIFSETVLLGELYPTLDVYSQEKFILGRQKRSPPKEDCEHGDGETKCCRYPLWVSFADLGWDDWVLAPEGYQAYYCDGSCPYKYKLAHTFAEIQAEIHHQNPAAAPAPCCSASKLSSLNLLHFGPEGHLMVSLYDDMVVEECKCE